MRRRWFLITLGVLVAAYLAWYTRHPLGAGNYVERGIGKAQAGDLDGAVEDFTAAIETERWKPEGWYNRGKAHYERQDRAAAVRDLTEGIDRGCTLKAEALVMRARARHQLGEPAWEEDLEAAARLKPDLWRPPTGP